MVSVATRLFSDDQLDQLRSFPDIGTDDLIRYFTLTGADVAFVDPGRGRGPGDRLGLAVQLCTLPWLGFVPDRWSAEVVRLTGTPDRHTEDRTYGLQGWETSPHRQHAPDYYGADRDSIRPT